MLVRPGDNGHVRQDRDSEWVRFWRSADGQLEAMQAHFRNHTYHRHSHETYSFGVTEGGAQSFTCRGEDRTSAAGMVMAFNPEDPHDGRASNRDGFTYRMIHISPAVVRDLLDEATGRPHPMPLFAEPVLDDPQLAQSLRDLHAALSHGTALERDEQLTAAILFLVRRGSSRAPRLPERERLRPPAAAQVAVRIRDMLHDAYALDLAANDLAAAAGCSRYVIYRAFQATYGLAPSEYQRQLRLRSARRLLALGRRPAEVAAEVGFADQAHLTRWFVRTFGITPGAYCRA
jgi:AraC-like DNA-binding protein